MRGREKAMTENEKTSAAQIAEETAGAAEAAETVAKPTAEEKPAKTVPDGETGQGVPTSAGGDGKPAEAAPAAPPVKQGDAMEQSDHERDLDYFIDKVENPDTKEYIRTRVVDQMNYYRKQSRFFKKQYFRFMTASIILGALIPVVSIFSDNTTLMKFLIAALGSAVTAINAYLGLNNSRDLWLSYRNSRQTLLQTLYYYFNDTSIFSKVKTPEEKDKLLIQTCERELENQHSSWRSLVEE